MAAAEIALAQRTPVPLCSLELAPVFGSLATVTTPTGYGQAILTIAFYMFIYQALQVLH